MAGLLETKLQGDWNRTGHMLKVSGSKLTEDVSRTMDECADLYMRSIKDTIEEGGPGWPSLTPDWAARKGMGERDFYRDTGDFISKLEVRRVKGAFTGQKITVGATPYKTHYSGLKMDDLATILQEYYHRPLFGPAWEKVKKEIEDKLAKVGRDILE